MKTGEFRRSARRTEWYIPSVFPISGSFKRTAKIVENLIQESVKEILSRIDLFLLQPSHK